MSVVVLLVGLLFALALSNMTLRKRVEDLEQEVCSS